jgi:hypothetical protein
VNDPVNQPSHYALIGKEESLNILKTRGIEARDIIRACLTEEEYRGWLKGSAMKYQLRAGRKDNEKQDIEKAQVFGQWLVELLTIPDDQSSGLLP